MIIFTIWICDFKTFHRIGFENADNEDCNVDNRKGSEYLGAREDEETES